MHDNPCQMDFGMKKTIKKPAFLAKESVFQLPLPSPNQADKTA